MEEKSKEEENVIPSDLHEDVFVVIQRPQRIMILLVRSKYCEVLNNNKVIEDEDLVHFSLLVDEKPINHNEALKSQAWNNAMVKELTSTKRNHTW